MLESRELHTHNHAIPELNGKQKPSGQDEHWAAPPNKRYNNNWKLEGIYVPND